MKLNRKIILLIIVLLVFSVVIFDQVKVNHDNSDVNGTADGKITHELIGNDSLGSVEVIKNIGDPSKPKIAYVVGVHPLENDTHKTFLKMLPNLTDRNYCYDVYVINVSLNFSQYGDLLPDDQPGRQEGQDLALKYVYPAIRNGSYEFVVDVHAHGGAYGEHNTFVFSPVSGSVGEKYGLNVSKNTQNISYYDPGFTTSGPYLTIPLNENGTPAVYYEENSFYSQDLKDKHMMELINAVDNLKI